ncbi:MAG: glycosyltransferase 87 family protein [Candidatus Acidiferrales bacterium]
MAHLATPEWDIGEMFQMDKSGKRLVASLLIGLNLLLVIGLQASNYRIVSGDWKMYYTAALALRSSHRAELYNPDVYSATQQRLLPGLPSDEVKTYTHTPYELLAYLPFSFLPYRAAAYAWMVLTLLLAVLCGRLLGSYTAVLGLAALIPVLVYQQDSVIALLLLTLCWRLLRSDKLVLAGLLLGLALFKFPLVLPLTLLLGLWKPRLMKGFAVSGAVVFTVSLLLVGSAGLHSYADYIWRMARDSSAAVSQQQQVDPRHMPTLRGVIYQIASGGTRVGPPWTLPVTALAALALLLAGWKFMRSGAPSELKFSMALLLAILLSYHLLLHDLVLLAIPVILLRNYFARLLLLPFYCAPLLVLFYPNGQAWLGLLLVGACAGLWLTLTARTDLIPAAVPG